MHVIANMCEALLKINIAFQFYFNRCLFEYYNCIKFKQ